jgi:hypothetical protein
MAADALGAGIGGPMTDPQPDSRASRRSFLTAAAGGALATSALPAVAAAQPADAEPTGSVTPMAFGAVADGAFDCTGAVQRAVDAGLERAAPIFFPSGIYRITRPIVLRIARSLPHIAAFGAGPRLLGSGLGHTIFDNQIDEGALFDLDGAAADGPAFHAALGCRFEGFTIRRTIPTRGGSGIRLRSAFQVGLSDLQIIAMSGDGVIVECREGDHDGSNMIALEQVRIENCRGWGLVAAAAPNHNEISFIDLDQVSIQGCGTASGDSPPRSGGMKWKGQVCSIRQSGFSANYNCGLFIPGEAGLAQSIDLDATAFENNLGRHILCGGISGFKARNLQFYNNDDHRASVACEFDGRTNSVRSVDIDGVVVRATGGNRPYTAFRIGGQNAELDNCRVRNVVWENCDYPGQRRFDGWLFDSVRQCCRLQIISASQAVFGPHGEGNTSPLRLRGGAGGAPSRSGEWVAAAMGAGLVVDSSGLAPDRPYNVYLYDDGGVKRLEAVGTPSMLDPASGYFVREDDATRLFVGRLRTGPGGGFVE